MSDGGDIVYPSVVSDHESFRRQTSAFRYILSFQYLTDFFYFNENAIDSTTFLYNEIPVSNFRPNVTINNTIGTVLFGQNELEASAFTEATIQLILTNSVRSGERYEINFEAEWNSMPYSYDGGRSYNYSGKIIVPIATIDIVFSYITSDSFTPGQNLQLQEVIFVNFTVFFPEVRHKSYKLFLLLISPIFIGNFYLQFSYKPH